MSQTLLLPQLCALLPADQHAAMLTRLSRQALHVEGYHVRDDMYVGASGVVPGQSRVLRLRARRKRKRRALPALRWAGGVDNAEYVDEWEYALAWVSAPLSAREYADMRVQALVGVDVEGMSARADIEEFVQDMGFIHSHAAIRVGYLFHLPVPGHASTLHLTITRVLSPEDKASEHEHEPYLVQLHPGRPVPANAPKPEIGFQDMMRVMRDVADRIDGIAWESGREAR